MEFGKRKLIIVLLLFLLFLLSCLTACFQTNIDNVVSADTLKIIKIGKIEKEYFNDAYKNSNIFAKGKNITINYNELEYLIKKASVLSKDSIRKIKKREIDYLVRREVLFFYACALGYECEDKELEEYISLQIKTVNKAENKSDFMVFLNAADMTIDEYYRYQKELFRKELTISNYLNSEKKELAKKNNLPFYDNTNFFSTTDKTSPKNKEYYKLEKLWKKHYSSLIKKIKEKENIVFYGGLQ